MKRFRVALVGLFSVAVVGRAQTLVDPQIQVQVVVSGLTAPTTMAFIGTNDILVLEKNTGQVRRITGGVLQTNPVLDVAVDNSGERGLLGIAVHPGFATNNLVYLCYTESSTGSDTTGVDPQCLCINRYEWTGNVLTNGTPIFGFPVTTSVDYHISGVIAFGPDGKLYAVTGDQGRFGQLQNNNAGSVPDDTSVIVRLNDDGTAPSDNPFFSQLGLTNVFAYGVRNSFGLAFDPSSGKLWNTENGPSEYDEVNLVEPGFNSGWREIMGPLARTPGGTNNLVILTDSQYADPKFSWSTTVAPTALVFLNSTTLGNKYKDDLFVGDFNNSNLYHLPVSNQRTGFNLSGGLADAVADSNAERDALVLGRGFGAISDLKVGPDGRLYIVSITAGKIYALFRQPGGLHHDLAVTKLKAPKKITLTGTLTNRTGKVKVTIQNRSNHTETIDDLTMLTNLVDLDVVSLGACAEPTHTLVPPKTLPVAVASKKKLKLTYLVTYDCANDVLAGAGYEDYRTVVTVRHPAIDGEPDLHPDDDACPHAALPGLIDPNPDNSIKDKGCGGKISAGVFGADVKTDVVVK
jgi:aldose sugar dehydrogenase